ncbi:hypothetical protein D4N04_08705 [Escherichia coli]|nr:hypothetical protein D4N04_08705 [Escherichia coli]
MGAYLIRRLLLVIPTLWAIITINFFIVQIAPGGPVDQAIAAIEFGNAGVLPGAGGEGVRASHAQTGVGNISDSNYRGGRGLDPEVIAEITHRYGFDKPIHERYFKMLWDYIRFDFGDSLFRSASVLTLIKDSLPVSITLGLWSTLIIYLLKPSLIILDEPTSSLDKTVQAQILTLLKSLQQKHQLAYLFISHDLHVVRALCHQVIVLRQGEVVEQGPCARVFAAPQQEYTRQLLALS